MMEFSAENLKYMAAEVVTNYIVNRAPLSHAVADKAQSSRLNTEQIKRLIEISNQVAYLKLLEKASDRTFEFPLADYEEVMAILATPDESMKKEASQKLSPMEIASGKMEEELEKVANTEDDGEFGFLDRASKQERIALLNKQMYRSKGELEKIASEEQVMLHELTTRAADLRDDEHFMDKVAMILEGDKKTLTKISRLVYGEKVDYSSDELFYESDLEDAREYIGMFKQAEELIEQRTDLEKQVKRASEILQKEAFVPQALLARASAAVQPAITSAKTVSGKAKDMGSKAINMGEVGLTRAEQGLAVADRVSAKDKPDVYKQLRG